MRVVPVMVGMWVAAAALPEAHAGGAGGAASADHAIFVTFSQWGRVLSDIAIAGGLFVVLLGIALRNPEWRARGWEALLACLVGLPLLYFLAAKVFKFPIP